MDLLTIQSFYSAAQNRLAFLNNYSKDMERSIDNYLYEHIKGISAMDLEVQSQYGETPVPSYYDESSLRTRQLLNDSPTMLRHSLLSMYIAQLEHTLRGIHIQFEKQGIIDLNSEENNPNNKKRQVSSEDLGIARLINSFSKVLDLSNLTKSDVWSDILFYIKIRNRIAHSAGYVHSVISKQHKSLYDSLKTEEGHELKRESHGVFLGTYHDIQLDRTISERIKERCSSILKLLMDAIMEKNGIKQSM
ncbi:MULTISPECIES: hypothetical protein [Saccharibacillus]|uniref:hypothetical protein n=1 Tax=Saccharibacillus TaxID=456492 RepID=UPI00123B2123|nr:hypothetical protein [Saccharibacillus sp. WB 17]MWJ32156.1 hypothetical protein [Saccharibacillus sp. WB 17]